MTLLPNQCHNGQAVWTYVGHLICFHLVEKHQPNCVLFQFSMLQMPPVVCSTDLALHQIDLRGKHDQDWRRIHAKHIATWHSRYNFCAEAATTHEPTISDNYFLWYSSIVRRFITPEGALWHSRYNFYAEATTTHEPTISNNYFLWCSSITKHFITPEGALCYRVVRILIWFVL